MRSLSDLALRFHQISEKVGPEETSRGDCSPVAFPLTLGALRGLQPRCGNGTTGTPDLPQTGGHSTAASGARTTAPYMALPHREHVQLLHTWHCRTGSTYNCSMHGTAAPGGRTTAPYTAPLRQEHVQLLRTRHRHARSTYNCSVHGTAAPGARTTALYTALPCHPTPQTLARRQVLPSALGPSPMGRELRTEAGRTRRSDARCSKQSTPRPRQSRRRAAFAAPACELPAPLPGLSGTQELTSKIPAIALTLN